MSELSVVVNVPAPPNVAELLNIAAPASDISRVRAVIKLELSNPLKAMSASCVKLLKAKFPPENETSGVASNSNVTLVVPSFLKLI